MKKILFVSHSSLESGGAESDFEKLLSHFSSLNKKYEVYCLLPEGEGVRKYSQYCKKYFIFRNGVFPPIWINFREYIKYLVKGFIQIKEIKNIISVNKFDLIILNVSVLIIPLIYLKIKKHKIIVFIREYIKPDYCRKFIYKILAHTSNYLFSVSDILKNDYIKITKNHNISTVHSSIDKNQMNENLLNINISDFINKNHSEALFSSEFKILNIGPVCKVKNQIMIIEALNLLKKRGEQIPLFFNIGNFNTSDNYVKKLIKRINNYDLNEKCFFMGNINNRLIYSIIDKVDIIIISSLSEGMPLVLVEAMEFGKPLIAANVGGIPEIINDSCNGLLIKPTAIELFYAIKKLMSDENLRNNIVNNAHKSAEQYFDLKKNLSEIEKISNNIINN
jgi:glycosyltransferase involved in cell wall biosynthesis